jgi:hypothetical protein
LTANEIKLVNETFDLQIFMNVLSTSFRPQHRGPLHHQAVASSCQKPSAIINTSISNQRTPREKEDISRD